MRSTAVLLVLVLIFALAGCGSSSSKSKAVESLRNLDAATKGDLDLTRYRELFTQTTKDVDAACPEQSPTGEPCVSIRGTWYIYSIARQQWESGNDKSQIDHYFVLARNSLEKLK